MRIQRYTAISRKIFGKNVYATIPKGNMGYDQYASCSWHCSYRIYFCCFPLALANILQWPLLPFFQISLKNSELKTTHNTFRDCRVHFFRQTFSKQLYRYILKSFAELFWNWKVFWFLSRKHKPVISLTCIIYFYLNAF